MIRSLVYCFTLWHTASQIYRLSWTKERQRERNEIGSESKAVSEHIIKTNHLVVSNCFKLVNLSLDVFDWISLNSMRFLAEKIVYTQAHTQANTHYFDVTIRSKCFRWSVFGFLNDKVVRRDSSLESCNLWISIWTDSKRN